MAAIAVVHMSIWAGEQTPRIKIHVHDGLLNQVRCDIDQAHQTICMLSGASLLLSFFPRALQAGL